MSAYRFRAAVWTSESVASWHFVTLPHEISDEIDEVTAPMRTGFGSVRVVVSVGATTWSTSLFPDRRAASYVLPLKRDVRRRERIGDGDSIDVTIRLDR